ncbi:MAG: N-acyl amino acid synthase FeeM domain-containing protein [Pirellulales bacterium]
MFSSRRLTLYLTIAQPSESRLASRPLRLRAPAENGSLEIGIASTRRDYSRAFELVYRAYRARGYLEPLPGKIWYRVRFGLPTSRTIVAQCQARGVIGTLTVVGDNCLGLPMEGIYHRELQALRDRGRRLAEVVSLTIHPLSRSQSLATFLAMTQFMVQYACWRNFDDLAIAIHPRQMRFYQRWFRFQVVGPCRPHPSVQGNPAIACCLDLHNLKQTVDPALFERHFGRLIPESCFMRPAMSPADHRHFCRRMGILERTHRPAAAGPSMPTAGSLPAAS